MKTQKNTLTSIREGIFADIKMLLPLLYSRMDEHSRFNRRW